MPKIVTQEEFIERARKAHGDRYDYSKAVYAGTGEDVTIICKDHGEFRQKPRAHWKGSGCSQCVAARQNATSDTFIAKAREIHGDKYDYSKVDYKTRRSKVTIVCPEHGEFSQSPSHHLEGNGCQKCAHASMKQSKTLTLDEFLERAHKAHGDTYDYGHVKYVNNSTNVTIICREHGPFQQLPGNHVRGAGCDKCADKKRGPRGHRGSRRLTQEEFLRRSRETHGDKYDYSQTVYEGKHKKVTIICPEHGEFSQTPGNHWQGKGCGACFGNVRLTQEKFLDQARAVHGDKYDYSNTVYTVAREKITIFCPVHGYFSQTANSHLKGVGCPDCGNERKSQGVDYEARSELTKNRTREKYGVDNVMHLDEFKDKVKSTTLERYGVDNVAYLEETKQKRLSTNIKKYNAISYLSTEAGRNKVIATNMERYGVANVMQDEVIKDKAIQSRIDNGNGISSAGEERLYDMLTTRFGVHDVIRQYKSEVYPFRCDFYIPSRDLYIELNGHWSHNKRWFDADDLAHVAELNGAHQDKIDVWANRDVVKRNTARDNNLNYVVFWDWDIADAELWFAEGCPDAKDWAGMYTWLPVRDSLHRADIKPPYPGDPSKPQKICNLVKWHQFDVFYAREDELWSQSSIMYRQGLRTDIELYHVAFEQSDNGLGPSQCRDKDLLKAIDYASYPIRAYSQFDTQMMYDVLKKYNIKSVYDPCAGWGERLMLCGLMGVDYYGTDVNQKLKPGHDGLITDAITQGARGALMVQYADASQVDARNLGVDAVVTCPPYGGTEVYTEHGAENLDDTAFLNWWSRTVMAGVSDRTRYVCFQVNNAWKSRMAAVVERHGFRLIDELTDGVVKARPANRRKGKINKTETESMLVFARG